MSNKSNILDSIKNNTRYTSNIVEIISKTMKGNTFHHHYHILYSLRSLIQKDNIIYTEIGTFNGGSLCLMLQHPMSLKCVSIDPFHLDRTNITIVKENIAKFNINNYEVLLTEKFSTDKSFIKDLHFKDFTTDILFIDGDHSYQAVLDDFNNFNIFVSKGGFIVFDDYQDAKYSPEVKGAVDHIVELIKLNNLPFEIIGNPENYHNVYPSELKLLNEFILRKV
jgi:predicted O-methyltransferase YrrM